MNSIQDSNTGTEIRKSKTIKKSPPIDEGIFYIYLQCTLCRPLFNQNDLKWIGIARYRFH